MVVVAKEDDGDGNGDNDGDNVDDDDDRAIPGMTVLSDCNVCWRDIEATGSGPVLTMGAVRIDLRRLFVFTAASTGYTTLLLLLLLLLLLEAKIVVVVVVINVPARTPKDDEDEELVVVVVVKVVVEVETIELARMGEGKEVEKEIKEEEEVDKEEEGCRPEGCISSCKLLPLCSICASSSSLIPAELFALLTPPPPFVVDVFAETLAPSLPFLVLQPTA